MHSFVVHTFRHGLPAFAIPAITLAIILMMILSSCADTKAQLTTEIEDGLYTATVNGITDQLAVDIGTITEASTAMTEELTSYVTALDVGVRSPVSPPFDLTLLNQAVTTCESASAALATLAYLEQSQLTPSGVAARLMQGTLASGNLYDAAQTYLAQACVMYSAAARDIDFSNKAMFGNMLQKSIDDQYRRSWNSLFVGNRAMSAFNSHLATAESQSG